MSSSQILTGRPDFCIQLHNIHVYSTYYKNRFHKKIFMNMNYECYLNRYSLTFFGTIGLLSIQSTSVFLLPSNSCLRMALISSIISDVCFKEPFVLSFSNHTCSVSYSCVSKQVVMISLMCRLF